MIADNFQGDSCESPLDFQMFGGRGDVQLKAPNTNRFSKEKQTAISTIKHLEC